MENKSNCNVSSRGSVGSNERSELFVYDKIVGEEFDAESGENTKKTQIRTKAFAKLNLFLLVTGRQANGYHELQSLFTLIDLHDDLTFMVRQDGEVHRVNGIAGLAEEEDLVVRAARLLKDYSKTPLGVDIALDKHIPSGAGLGGGSSDAASTLLCLNDLWNTGLSHDDLAKLGLQLGADVPFFIFGQTAIATGVGEKLQAFDLKPIYYVVLRPRLFIATPSIFKDPDLVRNSSPLKEQDLIKARHVLAQGQHFSRNDLEAVALRQYPLLAQLIEGLAQAGFAFRMTGSGSCFFAPYLDKEQAEQAQKEVLQWVRLHTPALEVEQVFVTKGLFHRETSY